jgi:hypothetical protein
MSEVWSFTTLAITDIGRAMLASFRFDQQLWRELIADPSVKTVPRALLIVLLAGFSEAVAQSIALFLNRVSPRRFVISLLVSAGIFTCGFLFYVLSIGFMTSVLARTTQPTTLLIKSVSLAYAPLMLSFLTLIPYFGRAILIVLLGYHFIATVLAVKVTYALSEEEALLSVIAGAIFFFLLRSTIGRPLTRLATTVRNRTAGVKLEPLSELLPRYPNDDEER